MIDHLLNGCIYELGLFSLIVFILIRLDLNLHLDPAWVNILIQREWNQFLEEISAPKDARLKLSLQGFICTDDVVSQVF